MTTFNSGSVFRVRYPLPCASHYSRWQSSASVTGVALNAVAPKRESQLQSMHPTTLQGIRRRALDMLDAGMNCVEIARELSAHPQTIRKWKRHREAYGDDVSVTGLKRGPKRLVRQPL